MAKLTTTDLTSLTSNETSAISTINANNALIETAMENTLSRDGTTPNTMSADLDMNGNDLLNVGSLGISGSVTLNDIVGYAEEWANKAEDSLVSTAAGGDGSTEYSSLHWAAKSAADAVSTAADAVSTAADVVSTNADVVSAAASAAAAAATAAGLRWKEPVVVASTGNLTLSGEQTIDGVLTSADRVLVKDQSTASENGIYVTAAGSWARATDLDAWSEVPSATVVVMQGTANADTSWVVTSDEGGTIDSTNMVWAAFGAAPVAGSGVAVSGTTVTADPNNATDTVITASDELLFADASDSNNVKKDTVQGILDLVPSSSQLETFRNRIINGVAPYINQRGAQTGMGNGDYFADRWHYTTVGTGVADGDIAAFGGEDWIEVDVTTADASIAAGDLYAIRQKIEANNIADFKLGTANAAQVTLSFKHAHTKTGTYGVAFLNSAGDRSYTADYTQSVADTEETSTVTLTLDTTGTWATGTGIGLQVVFGIAGGTDWDATPGSWQAGGFYVSSNQVNGMDSVSNFFRIRDVQIELGSTATDPEVLSYGVQLANCQRYYHEVTQGFSGGVNTSTTVRVATTWPVAMRSAPSLTLVDTTPTVYASGNATGSGSALSTTSATTQGVRTNINGFSGLTAGDGCIVDGAAPLITVDAEL